MPFPNSRVIPKGWSRHHARTAAGGMNATVQVVQPGYGTIWDEQTEQSMPVPGTTVYDGLGRVQAVSGAGDAAIAAESVTTREYLVQLTMDAPHIEQGWTVTVTECANDADLVAWTAARPMVIQDVQHGSERFTRDLVCRMDLD